MDKQLVYFEGGALDGMGFAIPLDAFQEDEVVTPSTELVASLRYRKTPRTEKGMLVYEFVEVVAGT